jgi:pimeloyl-ACP methyl ester carboxylesterase
VSDPPVVLVHGFGTSAQRTWGDAGWLDLLADAGRTAHAPDLLGHGDAPKPHDPAAYGALATRLLDGVGPEPVDGIGFSLGSRLLLDLASTQPGRFHRIVVSGLGANALRYHDPEPVLALLEGRAGHPDDAAGGEAGDPSLAAFRRMAASPGVDNAALAALLRRPGDPSLTAEALARVQVPVLVVMGDRDFAGPPDPLVELLPQSELVVLRGVDHFGTPRSPAFLDAALRFLGVAP